MNEFREQVAKKILTFAVFLMVCQLVMVFCMKLWGFVRDAREEREKRVREREQNEITRQRRRDWERARERGLVGILKHEGSRKAGPCKRVRFEMEEERSLLEFPPIENRVAQSLEEEIKQYVQREDNGNELVMRAGPTLEDGE